MNCSECGTKMYQAGKIMRRAGLRQRYLCPKCGKTKTVPVDKLQAIS